jgi:trimeric autotransporter adhesin
MDQLQTRLDALEQHVQTLNQRTHTVTRQLYWWRGLACGLLVLAGLTWALPAVIAQEDAREQGQQGLAQRVAALEELLQHFSREQNEIFITGANLHLVNSLGRTDCGSEEEPIPDCPNGLGNLIVGYNESREPDFPPDIRTGSHNVVVGRQHNFSRFGGLVVGTLNTISGDFATVSGGDSNTASGPQSVVSGGAGNEASGQGAVVSGGGGFSAFDFGAGNRASGTFAVVSGGQGNTASGFAAVVSGGAVNTASGAAAVVSGGGRDPFIGEGAGNTASGFAATVSGGSGNTASGNFSSVSGGQNLTQETDFGWSAGSEGDEVVVGNFRSP